jgi:hypothetical protein
MLNIIFLILILVILYYLIYNKTYNHETFENTGNADILNILESEAKNISHSKSWDRDDWVTNPKYSPNITPKLITSQKELSNSNLNFENPKKIRNNAGHLIRPIEIDASPSSNTRAERPYTTDNSQITNTEYLGYINKSDEILKKMIKKVVQLSLSSKNTNNPIVSFEKSTYSVGYFDALLEIMNELQITLNIDTNKITEELRKTQQYNTTNIKLKCQNLDEGSKYLSTVAKNL